MPGKKRIVLATRNPGKVKELAVMLQESEVDVVGLDFFPDLPEVEETGLTFMENARLKAKAAAEATGHIAVADDSGLEVKALNGAPGIFSARFSAFGGEEPTAEKNNARLLSLMRDIAPGERQARFFCAVVARSPEGGEISASGVWEGEITLEPAGDNGFGYDPLFYDPALGRTAAQMSAEVKNSRSHRAKAMQALLAKWGDLC